MRISPNPSELPYLVVGMDGKIHEAFIDCDECVCGMKIKSRKDHEIKHARENGALWCNDKCMEYNY